jgi:hypothetical protein
MGFQFVDGACHRRGRHIKLAGRACKTFTVHHGDKNIEEVKPVHGVTVNGILNGSYRLLPERSSHNTDHPFTANTAKSGL